MERTLTISAEPREASIDLTSTALLIIDMQRDFLEPGGFGELLGNDVSKLRRVVEPCRNLLASARSIGMLVVHTREGHRSDLADLHPYKNQRPGCVDPGVIGTSGPRGRIMVRGEVGQDIVPELYPIPGEPVVDKPGKGSFYATDLECILRARSIRTLLICGVTTEVCVHTTIREANDRGYFCLCVSDCCGSYFDEFHSVALKMISAQGGIFGYVCESANLINAFSGIKTGEKSVVAETKLRPRGRKSGAGDHVLTKRATHEGKWNPSTGTFKVCKTLYIRHSCSVCNTDTREYCSCDPGRDLCAICFGMHLQEHGG